MSKNRFDRARIGAGIASGLLLTSCAGAQQAAGGDKAGGDADPVVLTMADATFGGHPAVHYFLDQVAELSDGSLRIDVTNEWGDYAPDVAQQVVRDVAAGEAGLAWVWTHAFDSLDVNAFRVLNAPTLIDSYPLQQAVLASDIPGEMLAALEPVGVEGIVVLADSMQKPFAVEGPLLSPADYEGITSTSRRSSTYEDALLALGANAEVAIHTARSAGLTNGEIQGFEMHLAVTPVGRRAICHT